MVHVVVESNSEVIFLLIEKNFISEETSIVHYRIRDPLKGGYLSIPFSKLFMFTSTIFDLFLGEEYAPIHMGA